MKSFLIKFFASVFLLVAFVPLLLIVLVVEGSNIAALELLGRPVWGVGHIADAYKAASMRGMLKELGDLSKMFGKTSGMSN